jgi:hypothetical protein
MSAINEASALLNVILKGVPYPHQIQDVDLGGEDCVRFTWRGTRFRVSFNYYCEEVGDGVLIGSDLSILLERALRLASFQLSQGYEVMPA